MTVVGVGEAKTQLSRLLKQVEAGGDVIMTRDGRPMFRIVPLTGGPRTFGFDRGRFTVPADFDDPRPAEVQQYFE